MKTIKIIDLLNKKLNDEELPKEFMYDDEMFIYDGKDYIYENGNISFFCDYVGTIYNMLDILAFCNKEVEIIEEKIGKIPVIIHKDGYKMVDCDALQYKIDELIDAVNELKGKSD